MTQQSRAHEGDTPLWRQLLDASHLRCPDCHQSLAPAADAQPVVCTKCSWESPTPQTAGVPLIALSTSESALTKNKQQQWKSQENIPRLFSWRTLSKLRSPSPNNYRLERKRLAALFKDLPGDSRVVEVGGSLTREMGLPSVTINLLNDGRTEILGSIANLPLNDGVADLAVCNRVLEHVEDPWLACRELERIVKPGGLVFCIVPFMSPYHRLPIDHIRFGRDSMARFFENCDQVESSAFEGPAFAMAWNGAEYAATFMPGTASSRLWYLMVRELAYWMLTPLRWLDPWFRRHPEAHKSSQSILYIGRKR